MLFERLGLPADRKGKTGYSTDARVLAKLRDLHPIVDVVEQWREQSKLLNTYLEPLPGLVDPEDGRLHTFFSQTTAATGRLSSIRPNLQNIPIRTPLGREIRSAFIAEDGLPAAVGRLLADRAADPRPPVGRAGAAGGVRTRRGHPPGDRRRRCWASRPRS